VTPAVLGILGGSGLYGLSGLEDVEEVAVDSPWGEPSDRLTVGRIAGLRVVFLARHGRGHRLSPSDINYRANIDALKRLGVTDLVSFTAVGSLREDLVPGTFVLADQFVDRTFRRASSFFGRGCVAHVPMGRPVSPLLVERVEAAASAEGLPVSRGGTYLCIEGPQFQTEAESQLARQQGLAVVGMTAMPEAKLAREAEIAFASVAMVTDFDCWHPSHGAVTAAEVVAAMRGNSSRARRLISRLAADLPREHEACPAGSDRALDHAIMTAPEARDPALLAKLDAVAGRILAKTPPGER
jgi:5'-methylthioadenosine phosphorylase